MPSNQEKNQAAFQKAKQELRNLYPAGRFVPFDDGRIVADADSFDELTEALMAAIGKNRPDVFVVQAGVSYPDEVLHLLKGARLCRRFGRERGKAKRSTIRRAGQVAIAPDARVRRRRRAVLDSIARRVMTREALTVSGRVQVQHLPQTCESRLARIIHDLQDGGGCAVWFLTWGISARNSPCPWDVASLSLEERGETDVQQIGLRAHWQSYEPVKRASPTLPK